MKISKSRTGLNKTPVCQTLAALVLIAAGSGLPLTSAYADNDGRYYSDGKSNAYQNQNQHRNNGRPGNYQQYDNHGNRNVYYGYRPDYRPPYYYAKPVYVPPPVYYQPWQSPGINLIFPLDLR